MASQTMDYENVAVWGVIFLIISALTAKKVIAFVSGRSQFKTFMRPLANAVENRSGIKSDLVIAQAALESGWGSSGLTKNANNLFGMMAGNPWIAYHTGKARLETVPAWTKKDDGRAVLWLPTDEHSTVPPERISYWEIPGDILDKSPDGKGGTNLKVKRAFRAYQDWAESVRDWELKISTNPRYAQAYAVSKSGDPNLFGQALQSAGYATDPAYADTIVRFAQAVQETPEATA